MRLPPFSRLACVFLMLAGGVSIPRCVSADEPSIIASDLKEETFGSAADQGRLAWAILEAIEQQNISPPPRQALIRVLTQALIRIPKDAVKVSYRELLERVDSEFLQCQSADEMAHVVERNERYLNFDRVIAELTSGFGENLGKFRLIRAKDHEVEEQFHGNRYVGLGINLYHNDPSHIPVIMKLRPGGPAERGGLKPRTNIHEIDGRPTENVPQQTILDWIRGPIGTDVTLKISHETSKEQRLVTLARGLIRFESLKDRHREPISRDGLRYDRREPIGWIHVETINGSTLHELRVAENQAREDGIRVLMLDFRGFGQPGDLHQSLLIADSFLDGGAIWTRIDGSAEPRTEFADRECLFRETPLIVLIDWNTGPCHCAIAAALQDAGRAKLIGESPEFNGNISTSVRLNGVPYSLTMETTRLNRSRQDRQWPLEPDYSVAENSVAQNMRASVNQTSVPTGFRLGDRVILANDLNSKSSDSTTTRPSNEPTRSKDPSESAQVTHGNSTPSNRVTPENSPVRPVPIRKRLPIEDVAILVALEIQRGLPPASVKPASSDQNTQHKESTR